MRIDVIGQASVLLQGPSLNAPPSSSVDQDQLLFTEIIGGIASIDTLEAVIIAFFESNGNWVSRLSWLLFP